jgi:hypothetical protein
MGKVPSASQESHGISGQRAWSSRTDTWKLVESRFSFTAYSWMWGYCVRRVSILLMLDPAAFEDLLFVSDSERHWSPTMGLLPMES